jgi:hypothetical protein
MSKPQNTPAATPESKPASESAAAAPPAPHPAEKEAAELRERFTKLEADHLEALERNEKLLKRNEDLEDALRSREYSRANARAGALGHPLRARCHLVFTRHGERCEALPGEVFEASRDDLPGLVEGEHYEIVK